MPFLNKTSSISNNFPHITNSGFCCNPMPMRARYQPRYGQWERLELPFNIRIAKAAVTVSGDWPWRKMQASSPSKSNVLKKNPLIPKICISKIKIRKEHQSSKNMFIQISQFTCNNRHLLSANLPSLNILKVNLVLYGNKINFSKQKHVSPFM